VRSLIHSLFFRSVDAASLAVFRMMFGALILFEAVNYGVFLDLDTMYRAPDLLFKYHHFEWAVLPPGAGLEWLFALMGLSAIGVMLGAFYRLSATVMAATFGYHFLLDQALYLNHFYLAWLFAVILVFVPAHTLWSVDARRRPALAAERVPNWGRFWLAAQLEIVLVYAGLVKFTGDWLQLEPMRLWMTYQAADAGPLFQWLTQDPGIALASYGVIALHLIGAPLLLFERTRLPVFCVYAVFHAINASVFNIGIFPFMTIGATLLLFDPSWPRRFLPASRQTSLVPGTVPVPASENAAMRTAERLTTGAGRTASPAIAWRTLIVAGVCVWLVAQAVVPLRHYTRPGNVAWNEDGHRFSWRMKLRSKRGSAQFVVRYPDGSQITVDPARHLNRKQLRKMACIPDLLWQFAQFTETAYRRTPDEDVSVHAWTSCSLNTREPIALVKRGVDLTAIARDTPPAEWLMPNRKPLPRYFF